MIKHRTKLGTSLIEMLLALAILSISMYPLVYIVNIAMPEKVHNDDEYLATMLAHHVIETIVAKRAKDPTYLPSMTSKSSVVNVVGSSELVSEYFRDLPEYNAPIMENIDPQLYWALNKFKCQTETYFLDENMFKVIVYITYEKDGREMKVFFERLLPQPETELYESEGEF